MVDIKPHYHYSFPHGNPCTRQDCPEWLVDWYHSPDEPCVCAKEYFKKKKNN